MGNFKRGLILGGVIGAGLAWLNLTKEGKAIRNEAIGHAAVVYEKVKEDILKSGAWKKMKKSDLVKKVTEFTEDYAKEIGLARSMVSMIATTVVKKLERIKDQM